MKILIADDHELFREGMRFVLNQLACGVSEILETNHYDNVLKIVATRPDLDLLLLDLNMPGSDAHSAIRTLRCSHPDIPIVVISANEERAVVERVMNEGASGFICKSATASVMLGALNLVLAGGVYVPPLVLSYQQQGQRMQQIQPSIQLESPLPEEYLLDDKRAQTNHFGLSPRQMDVLACLRTGMSNKEIARKLGVAEGTVKVHVAAVYQALHVNNRMGAVRIAEQLGIFSEEE